LAAQLERAHAAIVVGEIEAAGELINAVRARGLRVFHGRLVPEAKVVASLAGRRVLAFAGIAHPDKFFATLAAAGIDAPRKQSFPDHHRYAVQELASLLHAAEAENLVPLTTEKDLVRLAGEPHASALLKRAQALPVRLMVEDPTNFRDFVLERLSRQPAP
jgi:tetraacyldisaccharide 4'-kinase